MKTKFFLQNPKDGSNTIYLRVRIGRAIDLTMATKETVNLEDWDSINECLLEQYYEYKNGKQITKRDAETKHQSSENKIVNYRLLNLKREIEESYKSTHQKIDKEWLKNIIYPQTKEDSKDISFIDYCNKFLESKGTTISNDYVTKVNCIKKIIERYIHNRKLKHLLLIDIDNDFKNDFERFCTDVEKYSINYFERNFKFIKTILYHAQGNGYPIYSGLNRIRCKTEKTMFVFLTTEELDLIEKSNFSDEHLETAKDWLLISCFSGQRISDFMRFDTSMITEKVIRGRNRYFIEFTQEKTNKQISLVLDERIIKILKKRNWSFPRKMSEQRYNEHIKKICEYVGIDEIVEGTLAVKDESDSIKTRKKNNRRKIKGYYPKWQLVSSHIGRRSFASNNFGKIPTPLLMVATGHSTPTMLMKYIGKIDEQQSLALAEYL
ncbi:phage integrase SAM-like domain-containing protein [Epilithonimonas sp.]|uniref:phage integrase SAM-like domain-containing protein n=1 Tax=Epilithonimonas sp. TaxID=2894511 RepID=UPI00289CC65D|nr:phage integrase SAM-like domain-containing protein [Epilithonimonas sp.]